MPDNDKAKLLASRATLVKAVYELWEHASSYEELIRLIKGNPERWVNYMTVPYKFNIETFNLSVSMEYKVNIIDRFSFLDFQGVIDLKNPDITFTVLENYGKTPRPMLTPGDIKYVYFGVLVANGNRSAIDKITLKRRRYLGTTSMDAELSLVMANLAHARRGALVYDPCVGTGSFLVSCGVFGASVMGSDIDGRQIRGREGVGVLSNLEQYGLLEQYVDCLVTDMTHHPFRDSVELFDAIVTDPPYGVRAGAKRIAKDPKKEETSIKLGLLSSQSLYGKYPHMVPYELDAVMNDLTDFAARYLRIGGRLVYWLPTVRSEYEDSDVPMHPVLRLVANSEQCFGGWSRRLITLEKIRKWECSMSTTGSGKLGEKLERGSVLIDEESSHIDQSTKLVELTIGNGDKAPAHKGFRQKYFNLNKG